MLYLYIFDDFYWKEMLGIGLQSWIYFFVGHSTLSNIYSWNSWNFKQPFFCLILKKLKITNDTVLCWSIFKKKSTKAEILKKLRTPKWNNFIKKRLQHKCFPVNVAKINRFLIDF